MRNCYNSGKITGNADAYKAFLRADFDIIDKGFNPINPIKCGLPKSFPWLLHMVVDILILVFTCRYAYFQSNWKESRGARIEHFVCKLFFIKRFYQPKIGPLSCPVETIIRPKLKKRCRTEKYNIN